MSLNPLDLMSWMFSSKPKLLVNAIVMHENSIYYCHAVKKKIIIYSL
jgi:hypothetical protein